MSVPAWQGDWEKRIYDRVHQRDFPNLTAFSESRSTATLKQLARELAPENDIAAVQLEQLLRQEARAAGQLNRFGAQPEPPAGSGGIIESESWLDA